MTLGSRKNCCLVEKKQIWRNKSMAGYYKPGPIERKKINYLAGYRPGPILRKKKNNLLAGYEPGPIWNKKRELMAGKPGPIVNVKLKNLYHEKKNLAWKKTVELQKNNQFESYGKQLRTRTRKKNLIAIYCQATSCPPMRQYLGDLLRQPGKEQSEI
jgi:hypothetical protein